MPIRPWTETDLPVLQRLNEAAVPAVNSLSTGDLRDLLASALIADVIEDEGTVAGFVLCLSEGTDYDSPNYRWFDNRYARFAYVDRVVVDSASRGRGLGGRLYDALEAKLIGLRPRLGCEVNEVPPNRASMRFHTRRGFTVIGRQATEGGQKQVALLVKPMETPA